MSSKSSSLSILPSNPNYNAIVSHTAEGVESERQKNKQNLTPTITSSPILSKAEVEEAIDRIDQKLKKVLKWDILDILCGLSGVGWLVVKHYKAKDKQVLEEAKKAVRELGSKKSGEAMDHTLYHPNVFIYLDKVEIEVTEHDKKRQKFLQMILDT